MRYEITFKKLFGQGMERHRKAGNRKVLDKIGKLLDELEAHPRTGTGHPKPLGHNRYGEWSRRITQEHRLVYTIDEEGMTVVLESCYRHYEEA